MASCTSLQDLGQLPTKGSAKKAEQVEGFTERSPAIRGKNSEERASGGEGRGGGEIQGGGAWTNGEGGESLHL